MDILGIDLKPWTEGLDAAARLGRTPVLVARDGAPSGWIALADAPRPDAAAAVAELRGLGLRVRMLTGDSAATAAAVAAALGLEEVDSEVMPPDKAERVKSLQQGGARVAMVGDGINDAPALVQADVGIAVSRGADVAVESADVVLMKNDLGRVGEAIRLGRAARRIIRQNFSWAFGYNALLIPLAAGVLSPLGLRLDPMIAAAAMALSSITVVANSLRLGRVR
jgi:P-type E1-E2 ATPase